MVQLWRALGDARADWRWDKRTNQRKNEDEKIVQKKNWCKLVGTFRLNRLLNELFRLISFGWASRSVGRTADRQANRFKCVSNYVIESVCAGRRRRDGGIRRLCGTVQSTPNIVRIRCGGIINQCFETKTHSMWRWIINEVWTEWSLRWANDLRWTTIQPAKVKKTKWKKRKKTVEF